METLYELLGALPKDNAEGLRIAFRKAVMGSHPDLNPGDPDAGMKFRQIVRANEILSDDVQRAAYDHLLALADIEEEEGSSRAIAATIHRLATGAMALAAASFLLLGGYLMYGHLSNILPAPTQLAETSTSGVEPAKTMVTALADMPGPTSDLVDVVADSNDENTGNIENTGTIADSAAPAGEAVAAIASRGPDDDDVPPANDFGSADVNDYRSQAIAAYRKGDLHLALVKLDLAIARDPASSDAYVDRAIVYRRLGDLKRAYADIARAKSLDEMNRRKTPPATVSRRAWTHPGFTAGRSSTRS